MFASQEEEGGREAERRGKRGWKRERWRLKWVEGRGREGRVERKKGRERWKEETGIGGESKRIRAGTRGRGKEKEGEGEEQQNERGE